MSESQTQVLQHLSEARSAELALARVLRAQIAVTPPGSYRTLLKSHLRETRGHAGRVKARMYELDGGGSRFGSVAKAVVTAPARLFRGSGDAEAALENARDAYSAEAPEIATYTALENLARTLDDQRTAELAAAIRAEDERMRVSRAVLVA
jgi:ferritin-like metal-binding protein YciE